MLDLPRTPSRQIQSLLRLRSWSRLQRGLAGLVLAVLAIVVSMVVRSQTAPPAIPPISLSSDPLYASTSGDKPTMSLALSVEWPTSGAQYLKGPNDYIDDSYSPDTEYIGYYDAESCYRYNDKPTETPESGQTAADYKRFDRTGAATSRMCADAFSGNFLNWASSSAIDMLRLALSGGDRYIDREDLTILQRALTAGASHCLWNTTTFPAKQLQRDGGGAGAYWGAVPIAMRQAALSNDIWVANALDKIYFGTSFDGNCYDTSAYTLSSSLIPPAPGPISYQGRSLPSDASPACSTEWGMCGFTGIREVWFGADTRWYVAPVSGPVQCNVFVFGDPAFGTSKACYTRPYSGTWVPTALLTTESLNSDGFFYARVKVCDQNGDTLLDNRAYGNRTFCLKYPSGTYKPIGLIQQYSNAFRLAAFGYAMDDSRYGGVLRAPMKYVGSKTFDVNGQDNTPAGGNPAAEWDARTGVFTPNPDGDTTQSPAISGVVNYLNKFGRTGPILGRYKDYDPVGELYYETLRYLQGLPPSPAAIAGLNGMMYDGFPILQDWSALDPFANRPPTSDYSCLKSNIVVIGDIETHDVANYGRFPRPNEAGNVPDFTRSLATVASFEKGLRASYTDGQGIERETSNPNQPNPDDFGPQFGIAGTAYWAHTQDIRGTRWTDQPAKQRPGLRVKTFTFDVNQYGNQTLAANRQYRNQFFLASKYGGFESMRSKKDPSKPFNTWGNPFMNQDGVANNDVWQDPARPGEAATYSLQSSGREVLAAFDRIFESAGERIYSIAGAAAKSGSLTQGANNTLYQAQFNSTDWGGDLLATTMSVNAANQTVLSATPLWSAAARLNGLPDPVASRNIVVGNPGSSASPVASSFKWDAISDDLKRALNKPDAASTPDDQGEDRLRFILGDHSKEGTLFRNRDGQRLGDIINSGVAFSGAPSAVVNAETYASFRQDNLSRTPAVFVGANDGMLHAFDANTGDELFGYIPSWLAPRLSALTSKDYVSNHQSYVDATPVVGDAQVGSDWKTVLVGGTGAGGRGVYALDVTDPTAFSASKVMWEFTPADDIDANDSNHSLGHVVGRPQILKFRTSAPTEAPEYQWFAVVASGVNNYVRDEAGHFSTTGRPAIYLLDLAKPAGVAWSLGTNYYKISIPVDSLLSATLPTGVLNFKATLGTQQEVQKLFVGDLHGKLWKLDFRPHGKADWNMNNLSALRGSGTGGQPYPLFIARDASGQVQPISSAPILIRGEGGESIQVAFGTGKYLEAADRTSTLNNSFYVVHDDGTDKADNTDSPAASAISGRGRLQAATLDAGKGSIDVAPFVWGRATSDTDTTQRSGWYLDFPDTRERQIAGISLAGDTLIFSSLTPNLRSTGSTCGDAGGTGREYRINVDTGDGESNVSTVGLLGETMAMRIESATSSTRSDSTGRRTRVVTNQTIAQGTTGLAVSKTVTHQEIAGRLSWRQIHNYQELRVK